MYLFSIKQVIQVFFSKSLQNWAMPQYFHWLSFLLHFAKSRSVLQSKNCHIIIPKMPCPMSINDPIDSSHPIKCSNCCVFVAMRKYFASQIEHEKIRNAQKNKAAPWYNFWWLFGNPFYLPNDISSVLPDRPFSESNNSHFLKLDRVSSQNIDIYFLPIPEKSGQ